MKYEKSITNVEIITLILSIIAIISTVVLGCYTLNQNNKNVENTSRAFIFVDKTNITVTTAPDNDGIIISIPWKNFGVTPAINVVDSENSASSVSMPTVFSFPDQYDRTHNPRDSLAPGTTMAPRYNHLSRQQLQEMFTLKQKLYTWAWIEYNDIFSHIRHRTEFCVEMMIESISPMVIINQSICAKFNGFDETALVKPKTFFR